MQSTAWLYVLLARWLSPVRNRLCLAEGCGPWQTILAGHGRARDRPECRLDGGRRPRWWHLFAPRAKRYCRASCSILLHFGPMWPTCRGAGRVAKHFRPHRALASATLDARSLVDGRDVPVPDRDATKLLSQSGSLQPSAGMPSASVGFLSSSLVLICPAVRDTNALCDAARRGTCPASRARGAADDRGRRRGLDCARGQTAVDRNGNECRCGLSLSRSLDAQSRSSQGSFQADRRRWPSRGSDGRKHSRELQE